MRVAPGFASIAVSTCVAACGPTSVSFYHAVPANESWYWAVYLLFATALNRGVTPPLSATEFTFK